MICPWVIKVLKIQMFSAEATNFFHKVFTDVFKYREEHNVIRNDLAQTLMQARKELVLKKNSTAEGILLSRLWNDIYYLSKRNLRFNFFHG